MDVLTELRTRDSSGYINWRLWRYPDAVTICNGSVASRYIADVDRGFDPPLCLYGAADRLDNRLAAPGGVPAGRPHYRLECHLGGDWRLVEVLLAAVPVSPTTDELVKRYLALRMEAGRPHRRQTLPAERWQDLVAALLGQPVRVAG